MIDNTEIKTESGIEKRKKNLKPWPKGFCPPGAGRPAGSVSIIRKIKEILAKEGNTEAFAADLIKLARKGSNTAINQIVDRVDGPVPQKIEIETKPLLILKSQKRNG